MRVFAAACRQQVIVFERRIEMDRNNAEKVHALVKEIFERHYPSSAQRTVNVV